MEVVARQMEWDTETDRGSVALCHCNDGGEKRFFLANGSATVKRVGSMDLKKHLLGLRNYGDKDKNHPIVPVSPFPSVVRAHLPSLSVCAPALLHNDLDRPDSPLTSLCRMALFGARLAGSVPVPK